MADLPRDDAPYPPARLAWLVVAILMLAYVFSFLDRQILALMIQPMKRDLGLSDTAISLLLGLAFGVFYSVLGVPLGRLADSHSRRGLIAAGMVGWCLMTVACGLARDYGQLFAARVGLGIGEATLAPAALSMISDYFPRESRGRAISVYNGGISIGIGIALIVGGSLVEYVSRTPSITLPLFGETRAWQAVFIAVGLPGLLIAVLVLAVPEPVRRGQLVAHGVAATSMSFGQILRYFAAHGRSFVSHFVGMSVVTILGYAYFAWLPTAFVRSWHWTIAEIGFAYGVILLIFAPIGVVLGGWYADSLYRRGHKDAHMRATFFGALFVFVPWQTIAPLMPDPHLALAVLALATVGGSWVSATGIAALMMVVPNQMRGQATAVFYLVLSILGLTLGPSAVALVTDRIFHDEAALRYSIGLVCGVGGVFGLAVLGYNLRHYRALVQAVEESH